MLVSQTLHHMTRCSTCVSVGAHAPTHSYTQHTRDKPQQHGAQHSATARTYDDRVVEGGCGGGGLRCLPNLHLARAYKLRLKRAVTTQQQKRRKANNVGAHPPFTVRPTHNLNCTTQTAQPKPLVVHHTDTHTATEPTQVLMADKPTSAGFL